MLMGWEELKTESATQLDLLHHYRRAPEVSHNPTPAGAEVHEESLISCLRSDGFPEEEGDKKRGRQIKESEPVMELGKGHGCTDSNITCKSKIKASLKPFIFEKKRLPKPFLLHLLLRLSPLRLLSSYIITLI